MIHAKHTLEKHIQTIIYIATETETRYDT